MKSAGISQENGFNREMVNNIQQIRDSVSGVSLDEEMTNLIKFQHAYTAAGTVRPTLRVTDIDGRVDTVTLGEIPVVWGGPVWTVDGERDGNEPARRKERRSADEATPVPRGRDPPRPPGWLRGRPSHMIPRRGDPPPGPAGGWPGPRARGAERRAGPPERPRRPGRHRGRSRHR